MKPNIFTKTTLFIFLIFNFLSCKNENKTSSPNQKFFFKTSLAQWSIHNSIREDGVSPYEFAKIAHDLGFEGLEYVNDLYSDVTESEDKSFAIKEFVSKNNDLAAKYNLKNVLIMIAGEGDLASSNSEERMQAVENHKLWIDAANKMNCSAIRINLKGEKEIESETTSFWHSCLLHF